MTSTINDTKKSKKGRPAVDTEPVNLRLPRDVLDAIEEFRRQQEQIPTRPEAIRMMLVNWLVGNGFLPPTGTTTEGRNVIDKG
ncbi:hypothetical protein [Sinorhizobium meliloti]|uniref:hypothetical protein n=1 Tax=Rhizobium meliloti TaxID=382 RepID=UPI003F15B019